MKKYMGEIRRNTEKMNEDEVVKFPFAANDYQMACEFVDAMTACMPSEECTSGLKYRYQTSAEEQ